MYNNIPFDKAADIMIKCVKRVGIETVQLSLACGRVLASDIVATTDIPPFDRSPFDGYALRTADTAAATAGAPVTLQILEEVPAGSLPTVAVTAGTAVKILTGSPVPKGADTVVKYELTKFDKDTVTLFEPVARQDITRQGEDVTVGTMLASVGHKIDPATMGTLAAQGLTCPYVYKIPKVGIISVGEEIIAASEEPSGGKIRDTNRYILEGAVLSAGAQPVFLGKTGDRENEIAQLFNAGLESCDLIISTGGAAMGDYDATPAAMEAAGMEILVRKIDIKPGGSCAYAVKDGKAAFALPGNPAAAIVNFYTAALPCIRKMCGLENYENKKTVVTLAENFTKKSAQTRLLRGKLDLAKGDALMHISSQGSAMLHATIGCDVIAIIPAGMSEVAAGTKLLAYLI